MRIALIRADGSKQIGMGHICRAWLLSDVLQERFSFKVKLIMKNSWAAKNFLQHHKIETIFLPESISINDEIGILAQVVEDERPSLLIIDVLEQDLNIDYMNMVRSYGCPVIAITDDSLRREIDADIVINGNPNQLELDYSDKPGRYLLGPKYFLMDPEYRNFEVEKPDGSVRKILLSFGGSDHNNLLFRVLQIFKRIKLDLSLLVITSKASGYLDSLKEFLEQLPVTFELFVDVNSLISFWGQCDIAITAAGNTLFERIATRLPGATLCQLERQVEIADCFEAMGVNVNLGFGPDVSDETLLKRIIDFIDNRELQRLQYQRSPDIIDGKGFGRLINEIPPLLRGVS